MILITYVVGTHVVHPLLLLLHELLLLLRLLLLQVIYPLLHFLNLREKGRAVKHEMLPERRPGIGASARWASALHRSAMKQGKP